MSKKSRKSSQSPVHFVGVRATKRPCASSAMNLLGHGGTSPKQPWKSKEEKKEAAVEQRNPTNNEVRTSKGKVSMVCADDQTALHSPVWISSVKFTRCLIDSGSEVNLISVKYAIKR